MDLALREPRCCVAVDSMPSVADPRVSLHRVPLRRATSANLEGFATLVRDFDSERVMLVPWPSMGSRTVERGTGVGAGVVSGRFEMRREGGRMVARNYAVGGSYLTGWFADPASADGVSPGDYSRVLVREANYHPDGGQVVYPRSATPYVALLARAGDDITPESFVAFWSDGTHGLQILPGVWHQPFFPIAERAEFDNKQGAVHACIACDVVKEFGCYLSVPLPDASEVAHEIGF